MSREKHMTRREALRKMGGATAGGMGLVIAAANAADVPGLSNSAHKERKMKALAINGSSRKDGNTADMLNVVLAELGKEGYETEHVQLAGSTVNACKACFGCAGRGNCVFGNDIFQELYDKMVKADAIILGSSTYSADVSSTLKAVIERASVVSDTNPGMFRHKVGGAVAVARRAGAMNAIGAKRSERWVGQPQALLIGTSLMAVCPVRR